MFIDSLPPEQMKKLIKFIGYSVRPMKAAKLFFPEKQKGYIKYTNEISKYFWNKLSAYLYPEERQKYTKISAEIWCDLPVWARIIPDDVIKEICKNE